MYADNDERSLQKELLRPKLNWVPDIIHVHGWWQRYQYTWSITIKTKRCFLTKIVTSVTVSLWGKFRQKWLINQIGRSSFRCYFDLESPDYESIIKATIKHSDVIIASDSLSKFNKIYRIFRKTFTFRAQRWIRGSVYQFYQEKVLSN
jgi:starch synthase